MENFIRYVILLTQVPGKTTSRELVSEHVKFLRSLATSQHLEGCGPFTNYAGGMIVIKATHLEEAKLLAEKDPFVVSGSRTCEVREWQLSCEENNHLGAG